MWHVTGLRVQKEKVFMANDLPREGGTPDDPATAEDFKILDAIAGLGMAAREGNPWAAEQIIDDAGLKDSDGKYKDTPGV